MKANMKNKFFYFYGQTKKSLLGETQGPLRLSISRGAIALVIALSVRQSLAEDFFNPNAIEIDNPTSTAVDLSSFSSSGAQAPGSYRVDVYINGEQQETREVNFIRGPEGNLVPQVTPEQLEKWGVALSSVPQLLAIEKTTVIDDLSRYISQARTDFDFSNQKLKISVPQASMKRSAQGWVDPKYWDEGIPALILGYSFTGANIWHDRSDGTDDSYFMNLQSGANFGGWRLRNYSTWTYNKSESDESTIGNGNLSSSSSWDSINTYVQHDLYAISGQFTAGESYTPSDVFDSLQFLGAQIASDDNMLPDSLRGFAPIVRGIANSNAQVTIKQNGSVIYQTYVPPGAFTIDDLYPTSSSGDMQVTIKETDGSTRTFIQPFSSVPVMQREGRIKYALTFGEYRTQNDDGDEPLLGQGTLIYGLPHDMTVYGGFQTSENYNAFSMGMGFGLGFLGSFSMDATQAYTKLDNVKKNDNESEEGQSYRFQYSKDIAATDSTVTLAGYRYSTAGFYTFGEAMDYRDYYDGNYENIHSNKRSKLQLDLSQNLMGGKWGSLSFSGYQQDYWNESGYERSLSASYSNSILNGVSWTLMYTYTEYSNVDTDSDNNQQLALNVSVPLSNWLHGAYMNNSMNNDLHGKTHNQLGISGTALEDNNLSYSLSQSYGNRDEGYAGTMSANYKGSYGEVNAGYNYNDDSRQVSYGARGSMIAHQRGVTLGQSLSGGIPTVALVEAPGADGVKVQNGTGVRTDWRGYTIVPYLSSYKRSRVALDPASLSEGVELAENVTSVVPTAGAVVRASFKTSLGNRVLMTLMKNGSMVPFGATVSIDGTDSVGIVGDGGQVYLSGMPQNGDVKVKWGNGGSQQCQGKFSLPAQAIGADGVYEGLQHITVNCAL